MQEPIINIQNIQNEKNEDNFFCYLPISENNLRWDLYLTGVGCAAIPAGADYPPQGHPCMYNFRWETGRVLPEYQILLITRGQGIFESVKTPETIINPGDVIFLFPGVWHRYRPLKDSGWNEFWLSWNGERLYRLLKKGGLTPDRAVFFTKKPDEIVRSFKRILHHVQEHPAENANVLSAYAMEVLTLAMDNEETKAISQNTDMALPMEYAQSAEDPVVFKAMQIIWNHSYHDFRVDELVNTLPVTRRTLERKFRQIVGHSIGSEITRCRLERAKHLLTHTALPIKHIALAVGFSGTDWMGKVFQYKLGMTPSQYRKNSQHKMVLEFTSKFSAELQDNDIANNL